MKPLNLNKAKEGAKVCTRDGRSVQILRYDLKAEAPILAVVATGIQESVYTYYPKGTYFEDGTPFRLDLFMAE